MGHVAGTCGGGLWQAKRWPLSCPDVPPLENELCMCIDRVPKIHVHDSVYVCINTYVRI